MTLDDVRKSYGLFFLATNPKYTWEYFQQELLVPVFENIVAGTPRFRRTACIEPFGHSKTDLGTVNFIPFFMGHHPDKNVLVLSYGKKTARIFGRAIRNKMQSDLYTTLFSDARIAKSSRAADEFETVSGGHFYASGFDGTINGLRIHLMDVDDPYKNAEQAMSEVVRDDLRSKYNAVVTSRLEPDATILINTTRWAPDDLIGWRMEEDGAESYFGGTTMVQVPQGFTPWQIVHLQA